MNIHLQVFVSTYGFISLGYISRSGIAGSYGDSVFNLLGNSQTVFQSDYNLSFPFAMYEGPNFSAVSLLISSITYGSIHFEGTFYKPSFLLLLLLLFAFVVYVSAGPPP